MPHYRNERIKSEFQGPLKRDVVSFKDSVATHVPRRKSDHVPNLRSFQTRASLNIMKNELFPDVIHSHLEKSPTKNHSHEESSSIKEIQNVIKEEEDGEGRNDTSPSNNEKEKKSLAKKLLKAKKNH